MLAYKIWAPDYALWTQWAKPVLFATKDFSPVNALLDIPQIGWLPERTFHTMIVVDLPGKQGVEEGLALARLGYRPVPLYNGVNNPAKSRITDKPVNPDKPDKPNNTHGTMIVDAGEIAAALFSGAEVLRTLPITHGAPPAFLLDSNRMPFSSGKNYGWYDNRWCVFPQDMPSAAFLTKNGINEVIVRSDMVRDDLAHILFRYQEQKIKISLCGGNETRVTNISKPTWFKNLSYRFKVIMGLTRNPTGGFGALIPHQSSSGGG